MKSKKGVFKKNSSLTPNKLIKKSILLFLLFFILFIFAVFLGPNQKNSVVEKDMYDFSCKECNVIFINVELLRADHVDLINFNKTITPNIDDFFTNGVVFTNVRSPAGSTYPSMTSVFTSLERKINEHKSMESVAEEGDLLIDLVPTIPQILKQMDYATSSLNMGNHSGVKVNLDRGFDKYIDYGPAEITRQIDDAILEIKNLASYSNKFFLHTHFNTLHYPYQLPISMISKMKSEYKVDRGNVVMYYTVPIINKTQVIEGPFDINEDNNILYKIKVDGEDRNYSIEEYNEMRLNYDNQISYVDSELGKLFRFLDLNGFLDNTIVVLFANHGAGLFDNGIPIHGVCYDSCVHVPLLIKHPKIKKPLVVDDSIGLIDLVPTLYDMLDVQIDYNLTGKSFYSELSKNGQIKRESVYTTSGYLTKPVALEKEDIYKVFGYNAPNIDCKYILKDNFKLIIKSGIIKELYDLNVDPGELNDIYHEHTSKAQELESELIIKEINAIKLFEELKRKFGQ